MTYYVVKTSSGYVGARIVGEVTPDQPKMFAYTYTKEEAEVIAKMYEGKVEEL